MAKLLAFQLQLSRSNEYSGLISFRIDWFDFLVVQGTLKSLLQNHSSKSSILQHSAFFIVQLSHPYMTAGKTIAFTIWTFVCKVMSLLFNTLSKFVIALYNFQIPNEGQCLNSLKPHSFLLAGKELWVPKAVKWLSFSWVLFSVN